MFLKLSKLQVQNFRNLEDQPLSFSHKINCIFGQNGNGKTNLLEAIHFITNKKSFRKKTAFPQMLSMDSERAEIIFNSFFEDEDERKTLSGKLYENSAQWFVDGKKGTKIGVKSIFINPFDSFQFHNIPAFRRTLIDQLASHLSAEYKKTLSDYKKILKQRNAILSDKNQYTRDLLHSLDDQFNHHIYELLRMRLELMDSLNKICSQTFHEIFSEEHFLQLNIVSEFELNREKIAQKVKQNLQIDIDSRQTKIGAHRDDYQFNFDGLNSFEYCSLGQQKMSFLSLLFAYIELFRYKYDSFPIVLIDDVSGELDELRWKNLINYLERRNFQVFITTANENFKTELEKIEGSKHIFIDSGVVKEP